MLALTMGDPAGIGPEITARVWHELRREPDLAFMLFGDATVFDGLAPVCCIETPQQARDVWREALPVKQIPLTKPVVTGQPDSANAACVIESIRQATLATLEGYTDAVITNPISKAVLQRSGFQHPGHTEYLAELCGVTAREVMMLASPSLRVALVSIHTSLRNAVESLNVDQIVRVARTTSEALKRDFGIKSPRLALAGLNPHAGEAGMMGTEEITIIQPAADILRTGGLDIIGPLPPDTMFTPAARLKYDAAICMYHDQGLIPLKTLDMDNGVNVTLGLPIIRTSPDHGTAFDIAGKNLAQPSSLFAALTLAHTMAGHRRNA